tara:strand:- start:27701 stop:28261 length:561 start_codon:yes stop_codon:yes gene_type:complete
MNLQFYKPNNKQTGSACSFYGQYDKDTGDFFLMSTIIKQSGPSGKGAFKANKGNPKGSVTIKLSAEEAAGIVDAMERSARWDGYHKSSKQITRMKFEPWVMGEKRMGYSYGIQKEFLDDSVNKINFYIGLDYAAGRLLKEFLCGVMQKTFEKGSAQGVQYNRVEETQESMLAPQTESEEFSDEDVW